MTLPIVSALPDGFEPLTDEYLPSERQLLQDSLSSIIRARQFAPADVRVVKSFTGSYIACRSSARTIARRRVRETPKALSALRIGLVEALEKHGLTAAFREAATPETSSATMLAWAKERLTHEKAFKAPKASTMQSIRQSLGCPAAWGSSGRFRRKTAELLERKEAV